MYDKMGNQMINLKIDACSMEDENGFEKEVDSNVESDISVLSESEFEKPFNPRDIKIDVKPIPIERIISRIKRKEIVLSPDFQRKEVWDQRRKCRLIESLMLNIPLPIFYVSADENGIWSVVDGLQRLTAIKEFIVDKTFKLSQLEFWESLNGRSIDELPPLQYNQIMEATFQFVIISPSTPEIVRRNIFKRINTGGLPLSAQEIRHALYQGKGTKLLEILSLDDSFKQATANSIKDSRMGDREIILRLLAFYLIGRDAYPKNSDMDSFLCDALKRINQLQSLSEIREKFILAMKRAFLLFGDQAFRVSLGKNYHTPVNKSLFETVGCLLMKCTFDDFEKLLRSKDVFLNKLYVLLQDGSIRNALSQNSWKITNVNLRFNQLEKIFSEVIADASIS